MDDVGPFNRLMDGLFLIGGEVEIVLVHQRLEKGHLVCGQGKTVFARLTGSQDFHLMATVAQLCRKALCRDACAVIVGVVSIYHKENSHGGWYKKTRLQR